MAEVDTVVVVNPHSQGGATGKRWPDLADKLRRHISFDARLTEGPNDATRITREALRAGADRVIAIGGDGTINEVVNGFFEATAPGDAALLPIRPAAVFGLLPLGTGGDFRRTANIPPDFDDAAALLATGTAYPIDLGRLEYQTADGNLASRLFANIASFGVSGVVVQLVNKSKKRLGKLTFALATAKATLGYDNKRVRLTFQGGSQGDATVDMTINTVAVANGRFFGGAMKIAPNAELDDGLFDVVALGDFGTAEIMLRSRRVYAGTHLSLGKVSHRHATHVLAEPANPEQIVELDLDGENVGRLPATFCIERGVLNVIMPR